MKASIAILMIQLWSNGFAPECEHYIAFERPNAKATVKYSNPSSNALTSECEATIASIQNFLLAINQEYGDLCHRIIENSELKSGVSDELCKLEARELIELCNQGICIMPEAISLLIVDGYFAPFLKILSDNEKQLAKHEIHSAHLQIAISRMFVGDINNSDLPATNACEENQLVRFRLTMALQRESMELFDALFIAEPETPECSVIRLTLRALKTSELLNKEQILFVASVLSFYRIEVWRRRVSNGDSYNWREGLYNAEREALNELRILMPHEAYREVQDRLSKRFEFVFKE